MQPENTPSDVPFVKSIFVYPIKSCLPIPMKSATICKTGLLHDRNFMLVSRKSSSDKWMTMNMKQCPALSRIQPSIEGSRLRITHVGSNLSCTVDLEPDSDELELLSNPIFLWKCPFTPADMGEAAYQFFTHTLAPYLNLKGKEVRLCVKPKDSLKLREIRGNMPPLDTQHGTELYTDLNDVSPLLIGTQYSLDDLNKRLSEAGQNKVDIRQFRPNILISGTPAWSEDTWKRVAIKSAGDKDLVIHCTSRCGRCTVTTVDLKGEVARITNQPLNTLKTWRLVDQGLPNSPVFGMYGVFDDLDGNFQVNDKFVIHEETDNHRWIVPEF